jgi:hypothetical protein
MTPITQLHKHVAALDMGEDHDQRQALHSMRCLQQQDWNAIPQTLIRSFLGAFIQSMRGLQCRFRNGVDLDWTFGRRVKSHYARELAYVGSTHQRTRAFAPTPDHASH